MLHRSVGGEVEVTVEDGAGVGEVGGPGDEPAVED